MTELPPTGRRLAVVAAALALLLAGAAALVPAASSDTAGPVRVMTRNLYLGADLGPAIEAASPQELEAAAAHIFSVVQRTDFPQRAKALAREIADADPVLVGLQEVARWSSGPPGDPAPAATVEYDFLAILGQELAALGAPYEVVRVQPEADIEATAGPPYGRDVRLVQQDAVLVKAGLGEQVTLTNARSGHFLARLVVPTATGRPVVVDRGWVAVDAVVGQRRFRFVTTHLEAFQAGVRAAQAAELVAPTGPVGSAPGAVVLAGDLNTGPELPVLANRVAFQALLLHGLADTWRALNRPDPGYTAGFRELLDDPVAEGALEHRIDHVMTRGDVAVVASRLTGIDPGSRTPGGLWPSDHAGVVATLAP